jgi:hypothetical protein
LKAPGFHTQTLTLEHQSILVSKRAFQMQPLRRYIPVSEMGEVEEGAPPCLHVKTNNDDGNDNASDMF